jgi:hypothetical protein
MPGDEFGQQRQSVVGIGKTEDAEEEEVQPRSTENRQRGPSPVAAFYHQICVQPPEGPLSSWARSSHSAADGIVATGGGAGAFSSAPIWLTNGSEEMGMMESE